MVAQAVFFPLCSQDCVHLSDGYTAEFVERGRGVPLVLVPGLAGGFELLEPLIDRLAQDYRVICYRLRGESYGVFERGYGFEHLVTDLASLIAELRLERPIVAGISFGGAIALEYATRSRSNLGGLIVQGAATRFRGGLFADVALAVLNRLPLPTDHPFVNQFFRVLMGTKSAPKDQFDFVVDRFWTTDQCVMAHRLALLSDFDVNERLGRVSVPALVLAGDRDVFVSVEEARQVAERLRAGEFRTVRGAGHLAAVTHSAELARTIHSFVEHHLVA